MKRAEHFEVLVEEPSMELFLTALLPRILKGKATFAVHPYQGKSDLLAKLGGRLRGYARWIPDTYRILVLIDRDGQNCKDLKTLLENEAAQAKLTSRRVKPGGWNFASRIAIEELEAWYFGSWQAVIAAYPRVGQNIPSQAAYRDPDKIAGGTWEAFERVLQRGNYFLGGLRKLEIAREIGTHFDHESCSSQSFAAFRDVVVEAISELQKA